MLTPVESFCSFNRLEKRANTRVGLSIPSASANKVYVVAGLWVRPISSSFPRAHVHIRVLVIPSIRPSPYDYASYPQRKATLPIRKMQSRKGLASGAASGSTYDSFFLPPAWAFSLSSLLTEWWIQIHSIMLPSFERSLSKGYPSPTQNRPVIQDFYCDRIMRYRLGVLLYGKHLFGLIEILFGRWQKNSDQFSSYRLPT